MTGPAGRRGSGGTSTTKTTRNMPCAMLGALPRVSCTVTRSLDDDDALLFFSGRKGYHVGLPTFWNPAPSVTFHRAARRFAEEHRRRVRGEYRHWRLRQGASLSAPNSRHPKTGLHKRRLSLDELLHLDAARIRQPGRGTRTLRLAGVDREPIKPPRTGKRRCRPSSRKPKGKPNARRRGERDAATEPGNARFHPRRRRSRGPAPAAVQRGRKPRRVRLSAGACLCAACRRRLRLRVVTWRRSPPNRLRFASCWRAAVNRAGNAALDADRSNVRRSAGAATAAR